MDEHVFSSRSEEEERGNKIRDISAPGPVVQETCDSVDGRNKADKTQTPITEGTKRAEADTETCYCEVCEQWLDSKEGLKEHKEGVGHMLMQQAQTKEMPQNQASTPKERARPLDQGLSETCTLHAVANATVESLTTKNIDVKLDEVLGALKQAEYVDIHEGNKVEDFNRAVMKRMTDKKTGMSVDVELTVGKYTDLKRHEQFNELQPRIKFVLTYNTNKLEESGRHCVYIDKFIEISGKKKFVCVNSWGKFEENPVVDVDQPGNIVYGVVAHWKESRHSATTVSSEGLFSTITKWLGH